VELASIAEVVSGIAVVVTLVLLMLGIRDNTEVTRASMFQRSTDRIIEWRRDVMIHAELAELFQAYLEGRAAEFAGTDQTRLVQLVLNQYQIYEQAYIAERSGLLGSEEWRRFETQTCSFYPLVLAVPILAETIPMAMTSGFIEYIETSGQE